MKYYNSELRIQNLLKNTLDMPLRVKTLLSPSGESSLFDCTSGTTKNNAMAIIRPNVPTARKGNGNPPRL